MNATILKGMAKPLMIFIVVLISLMIIAFIGILLYTRNKNKKKFQFLLFKGNDLSTAKVINGYVKADPENPSKKKFFFDELDSPLEIRKPNFYLDGKPYRMITYNDLNEFSYLEGLRIDQERYLRLALMPEEKAISLHRYKEQQIRYSNPYEKFNAGMVVGSIVMAIVVAIAVIFSTYNMTQSGKNTVEVLKEAQKGVEVQRQTAESLVHVVEMLAVMSGQNETINRTLS